MTEDLLRGREGVVVDQIPNSAPRDPAGPAPLRRASSIRRTSTIDVTWPDGYGQPMNMVGRARDLITRADRTSVVAATAAIDLLVSAKREILEIKVSPHRTAAQQLVGVRGGGRSRALLAELLPDEHQQGTPLHLLLDDFAGASLVAGWAWSHWVDDWAAFIRESSVGENVGKKGIVRDICIGFGPGSTAVDADGRPRAAKQSDCQVESLVNPEDFEGWHQFPSQENVAMRRARRIDVWRDGGHLQIDVGFQDSATTPKGDRVAVHEYSLTATADAHTGLLISLAPRAHILPFAECPAAVAQARCLTGLPLAMLRTAVVDLLAGPKGCTHLNDVLRSVADVLPLAARLEAEG